MPGYPGPYCPTVAEDMQAQGMKISNSLENTIAKILIGAILVTPACAMIKVSPQPKTEYVQPKNKGSEFEKIVSTFKTPEDLEAHVLKNFTYEEDLGANERLLSEERMLEKRKGDCESPIFYGGNDER